MQPDNYDPEHAADLRAEYLRNLAGDMCSEDYEYEVDPDWDDYDWVDYEVEEDE